MTPRCILVVEDEPAIRDALRSACERKGFGVVTEVDADFIRPAVQVPGHVRLRGK